MAESFGKIETIDNAWEGLTERTLVSARRKLRSDNVVECDFERLTTVPAESVVDEIVYLPNIMGLEVDNNTIDELTTEDLMELNRVSR